MSPYVLSMEGIPVTRCVQNPGQYVIMFPGSYYSAVDCGFNCLEKANFAPLDWLPHGDISVQQNQEKSRKSLISYDKLLLRVATEAVKCLKEYILTAKNAAREAEEHSLTKKNTADNMRWKKSCGKNGLFSNIVKVCSPFFFSCPIPQIMDLSVRKLLTTFCFFLFYVVTDQSGEKQT